MLYYTLFITAFWLALALLLLVQCRRISYLSAIPTAPADTLPAISIIIAIRNEEARLREALQSVLLLDYPSMELILVNDRSTDRSARILDEFQERYPHIKVITITSLPERWLGKNHALYCGYKASTSPYLLFTDADVLFHPQTLRKAMYLMLKESYDHLVTLPQVHSPSKLLNSVLETFRVFLEIRLQPWKVADKQSKASIGVGAFNLITTAAYEKAGTHVTIALRPDDDLKLGEMVKKAGCNQQVVYGDHQVQLEWYGSVKEFIAGLMKNTFAVSDYNLALALLSAVGALVFFALPIPLLLVAGNPLEKAAGGFIFILQILLFRFKKGGSGSWWHGSMVTYASFVMVYIILKSAVRTLRQGGIYWRDTFYSLKQLKQ
jgi:cellulose synthase/poly-beta-1,6-N-acetylglucosamine synthase-like glycosyltransferase